MKRTFVIPAQVVPERTITRCCDCPHFENRGGSYGEYHKCQHIDSNDQDLWFKAGEDIAEGCPMLFTQPHQSDNV